MKPKPTFTWLPELLTRLENEHVLILGSSPLILPPAHVLHLEVEDFIRCISTLQRLNCRWCALWAEQTEQYSSEHFLINACYEKQGDYLIILTELTVPIIDSQTAIYPAANRAERHIQDLWGITFKGHPDTRRWTRHQAWSAQDYPLRKSFNPNTIFQELTPADSDYPFLQAKGEGVYEVPVGPVHAGIIEPGHFRFQAVGEQVLNLEMHLGYVHKGIEKTAEGRTVWELARLAGRVSGDSTVAHTWAACMAMERAARCTIPDRSAWLRAILLERERVANHLGDIGALCNDVAFGFGFAQFSRLRERWQRLSQRCFGHRLMMDVIIPGGVKIDLDPQQLAELIESGTKLQTELHELEAILERHSGLEDRFATTGILSCERARQFGCLGYVGRASGCNYDVRRDSPYYPYTEFLFEVPLYKTGDVETRLQVRLDEIHISLHLMYQLLTQIPAGKIAREWNPVTMEASGIGIVEGWRGEIITYVRFSTDGTLNRFFPRDPSWLNWPALEFLIRENIVPDFPVCNKSINGSYSGHDL